MSKAVNGLTINGWMVLATRAINAETASYGPFSTRDVAEQMAIALAGNPAIMGLAIVEPDRDPASQSYVMANEQKRGTQAAQQKAR